MNTFLTPAGICRDGILDCSGHFLFEASISASDGPILFEESGERPQTPRTTYQADLFFIPAHHGDQYDEFLESRAHRLDAAEFFPYLARRLGAKCCTPEIAKARFHWKMPLTGETPLEAVTEVH